MITQHKKGAESHFIIKESMCSGTGTSENLRTKYSPHNQFYRARRLPPFFGKSKPTLSGAINRSHCLTGIIERVGYAETLWGFLRRSRGDTFKTLYHVRCLPLRADSLAWCRANQDSLCRTVVLKRQVRATGTNSIWTAPSIVYVSKC